ncbi:MAG: hypothetical protein Tsb0021_14260 [Chlamydiales bacterium]
MNIIIVSTSTVEQEEYWQMRLATTLPFLSHRPHLILAVHEDWLGGAGNGLGTLYAFFRAREKGIILHHVDILTSLKEGAAVAIYHTAGKGQRLAPLTFSERNNKSAIKVPSLIKETEVPLNILESVIKQSLPYVENAQGRVSVFWGDQIFIPEQDFSQSDKHSIDVFTRPIPFPTKEEWKKLGLKNYGIVAHTRQGFPLMLNKLTYERFQWMQEHSLLNPSNSLSLNLGSFSISGNLFFLLMEEFTQEIHSQEGQLDTDTHFWMPMTLDEDTYAILMEDKNISEDESRKQHKRIQSIVNKLKSPQQVFGELNIGHKSQWWDFGTLQQYFTNLMKLTKSDQESQALQNFFCIEPNSARKTSDIEIKGNSFLLNSSVNEGIIENSILIGVNAKHLNVRNSIIVNCDLSQLSCTESIVYNVKEDLPLDFPSQTVRADLTYHNEVIALYTQWQRDSKEDWTITLPHNKYSFEEVYNMLQLDEKIIL